MFIPFLKEAFSVYMYQHFMKYHRYCPKCRLCTAFWIAPKYHYKDNGILVGEWIPNEEFWAFVGADSANSAKRLLQKLD
ncbi:hypothetical protein [Metasolibacillus sp. FSL K6-0083]|uniref:hypothetical protein n=1 Tax=Metasolibacillus sp. FSL K6-0083 TaxID=2921416 RepID=UPI003159DECE